MNRLFLKIFSIFCLVIVASIVIATFSFWVVQTTVADVQFRQQRNFQASMINTSVDIFSKRGEDELISLLKDWQHMSAISSLLVVRGDDHKDILGRPVNAEELQHVMQFIADKRQSPLVGIATDAWGQEYYFFIENWQQTIPTVLPRPPLIPGLPLAPIWHELIAVTLILLAGLAAAYILANYISKPIRILQTGFHSLAGGDLDTRIRPHMGKRQDELADLAIDFDDMAVELQRLVEKERHLLHHVSHEMRSPLARMQAILGLIQQQPAKLDKHLGKLDNELLRMNNLVGELLTLARLENKTTQIQYDDLSFNEFIENLINDSIPLAEEKQQLLQLNPCNDNVIIKANEGYLYQAFDNVLRNAIKYSPTGSVITINCQLGKQELTVLITDNGNGVDEAQLPHIFTAFYRADSSGTSNGTGLGLAIAKHVVEQHQGEISAKNVVPQGLQVKFQLPLQKVKTSRLSKAITLKNHNNTVENT
ncbi:sensor histidine kinase [Vitreoscilla stercoraria]|uniref:histidine kinase n=1 Tax=Vitreoscilla stercoraria TaxID=61 RepID=A0ABY4ECY6_VITST|nr:HAMP domain-containing sensor histidine kinase [Vitreoscilla stercoraria]UOO93239.1 HAMP domain-containing histidine kinase [Vitreoscilla stercoraria]